MYTRSFGEENGADTYQNQSIRSEGQLYNMQNELREKQSEAETVTPTFKNNRSSDGTLFNSFKGIFKNLGTDDLILIAIGLLILLDGDGDSDVLLIFIMALLFL